MTTALDALQKKYNRACGPVKAGKPAERCDGTAGTKPDTCEYVPGAKGWRGCASICLLRWYLKEHPTVGGVVGMSPEGELAMRFRPRLDVNDGARMALLGELLELFFDARDDIVRMVEAGEMKLRRFEAGG
jgi:hypothetical protein